MKLIIDIDEEIYKSIKIGMRNRDDMAEIGEAVETGILLPKGHGDLIDRNDLLANSYSIDDWWGNEVNIVDVMTIKMADAIIEADKESEE